MLKQRVITAFVLLCIFLPALFAQATWPFLALILVMTTLAAWEWARMNPMPFLKAPVFALMTLGLCVLDWRFACLDALSGLGGGVLLCVWAVFFAMVFKRGIEGWLAVAVPLRNAMGLIMLLGAWVSFGQAKALGTHFLMSVLALVWTADIGAYFVGRAWGQRKLAPILSPGKSQEGAFGGLVLVFLLGFLWMHVESLLRPDSMSIYAVLWQKGALYFVLGLMLLVACSVVGDLFESLLKRAIGFKDSSQLLPGHGGVLDRIDALLPTVPLAVGLVHWVS